MMTRIIKNEIRLISIYLEGQYIDEIMDIRIKKLLHEKKDLKKEFLKL